MSIISISIYVSGTPIILECLEPFRFKQISEINELAFSLIV